MPDYRVTATLVTATKATADTMKATLDGSALVQGGALRQTTSTRAINGKGVCLVDVV
jgi:hypothetical protein